MKEKVKKKVKEKVKERKEQNIEENKEKVIEVEGASKKSDIKWKDLRTQKDYMKVLLANSISRFGDSIDSIAFTWLVFAITKSASWSAIILALNYLPTIFIQPFSATLVEHMNKKKVIIITNMIRGLIVATLAVLYTLNMVSPLILVVFTLIISTVEAFAMPASSALVPKILAKEYYEVGVALNGTMSTVVQLAGLASAGIIISLFGVQMAILIDAITFFVCGLIMARVKHKEQIVEKIEMGAKIIWTNMVEGLKYAINKKPIRNFLFVAVILNALLVPLNALQVPLIVEVLKQGSEMMSVIGIALLLGMGLGSMVFPLVSRKVSILARIVIGGIVIGCSYILILSGIFFQSSRIMVYSIVFFNLFMLGFATAILNATVSVLFMGQVEESYFARVGGIMNAMATAAMPITSFVVGAVVVFVSVDKVFLACGVATIILFIIVGLKKLQFQ